MTTKTKATPEERKAKLDAALTTLETGVATLVRTEGWLDFLRFQARFHNYSARNVFMIQMQLPTATRVAGFQAWKALGRSVRKGEKGLAILAPSKRTVEDEKTGEKRSILTGFRVTYVWDVSQTDGADLPASPVSQLTDGVGDEPLRLALVEQIEAAGFTYHDEPTGDSSNGYTDYLTQRVVVDTGMAAAQRLKTTAHELAHVLLHDPQDPDRPASRSTVEVEAESVAFIVLHALGIDAGDYSFGYVAGWANGDPKAVQKTATRVQRAASRILDALPNE